LCFPSQSGARPVALQPQNHVTPSFSAVYFSGAKAPPLWLPSQKGCFAELPQVHQK
jgi:hypothetical protein